MTRLKLAAIEQKPKTVIVGSSWRDPAGIANDRAHAKTLLHIRKCIENGAPLPSTYYSKRAGSLADPLLQTHGIMHLHLGNWNTKELLWLVQYADRVVWLEISDHQPFRTRPPGALLFHYHQATIQNADKSPKPSTTSGSRPLLTGKIRLKPKADPNDPNR